MNFSIKTREVLKFIFFSLCCYALFIFGFAFIFYVTGSIGLTPYSKPYTEQMDFW